MHKTLRVLSNYVLAAPTTADECHMTSTGHDKHWTEYPDTTGFLRLGVPRCNSPRCRRTRRTCAPPADIWPRVDIWYIGRNMFHFHCAFSFFTKCQKNIPTSLIHRALPVWVVSNDPGSPLPGVAFYLVFTTPPPPLVKNEAR